MSDQPSKEIEATAAELKRLLDAFLDGLGVVHSDEALRREHELPQLLWDNKIAILRVLQAHGHGHTPLKWDGDEPAPADQVKINESMDRFHGGLPPAPAGKWQDIASAPKDGTRFIAFDRGTGNIGVAYRHDPGGIARNPKHHYETWVWEMACDTEPTHWRPLPSPPAIKGGEHKDQQKEKPPSRET